MDPKDYIYLYPTDTVWGMGVSIDNKELTDKLSSLKRVRTSRPYSILFSSLEELLNYFSFPFDLNEELFSYEITLGIPLSLAKKEIPCHITQKSIFVCARVVKDTGLPFFPITSTSLNFEGEEAATGLLEAKRFYEALPEDVQKGIKIIENTTFVASGISSSILMLDKNGPKQFLREGRFAREIKGLCGL